MANGDKKNKTDKLMKNNRHLDSVSNKGFTPHAFVTQDVYEL